MSNIELTSEDYKNIELRYKVDKLSIIASLIPKKYYLNKMFNTRLLKKPDTVDYERYNLRQYLLFEEDINELIKKSITRIESYSNKINLNTIYKNLKTLKVKEGEEDFIHKIEEKIGISPRSGFYKLGTNTIFLINKFKEERNSTFTHEFIHFASTVSQVGNNYSGFKQNSNYDGINEGTTEFINIELFEYKNISYADLVFLVKGLTNLIGEEKIVQLYFDNNINGLLDEISNYSDKKTSNSLINGINQLHMLRYETPGKKEKKISIELEKNLITLIANLNKKKNIDLFNNKEISQEEFEKRIFETVDTYEAGYTIKEEIDKSTNKKKYAFISKFNNYHDKYTEKEYKHIFEMYKRITTLNDINNKHKIMKEILRNIKNERIQIISNSDKTYGTTKGYVDINGNSLDDIKFNYKSIKTIIDKSLESNIDIVTITDIDGKKYNVHLIDVLTMPTFIMHNSVDSYFDLEQSELNEMINDNNEVKEEKDNKDKKEQNIVR